MAEITQKQKKFADEYILSGNASQSYLKAYQCKGSVAETNGTRLLGNAQVKTYIENVNRELMNDKIADMKEIKEFWTETVRDKMVERKDRLKASEYIAKTNAAFVDRVQHSGELVIFEGEDDLED